MTFTTFLDFIPTIIALIVFIRFISNKKFEIINITLVSTIFLFEPVFGIEQLGLIRFLGIITLFYLFKNFEKIYLTNFQKKIYIIITFLLLFVFFIYLNYSHTSDSEQRVIDFIFTFYLPLIYLPILTKPTELIRFYKIWVAIAVISALLSILQINFGSQFFLETYIKGKTAFDKFDLYQLGGTKESSGFGLFGHRSHNGIFLLIALNYLIIVMYQKKIRLLLGLSLMSLFIVGIVITRARFIILFLPLTIMLNFFLMYRYKVLNGKIARIIIFLLLIVTIVTLIVAYTDLFSGVGIRLEKTNFSIIDNDRIYIWSLFLSYSGLKIIDIFNPLGFGFGSSPPDNVYLTVGFELGFLALVIFVTFIILFNIQILKKSKKHYGENPEIRITSLIAIFIISSHLMIGNLYFYNPIFLQIAPFVTFLILDKNNHE